MPELKEMASLSAIDYRSFDGYLFRAATSNCGTWRVIRRPEDD